MSILSGAITKVCYVTHDLERAIERWAEGIKAGPFYVLTNHADFGQRSYRGAPAKDSFKAAVGFSGNTLIEFIQPTNDEPSVFQEVLKTKGEMALHHVYSDFRPLSAAEYEAICNHYLNLGYVAALDAVLPDGGRCINFDAREQLGVFVELLQCSPDVYASLEYIRSAHVGWDGHRPRREIMETMPQ